MHVVSHSVMLLLERAVYVAHFPRPAATALQVHSVAKQSFAEHVCRGRCAHRSERPAGRRRFDAHPLVVAGSALPIRFYAGAPLITSTGHRIGAMCAILRVHHCDRLASLPAGGPCLALAAGTVWKGAAALAKGRRAMQRHTVVLPTLNKS